MQCNNEAQSITPFENWDRVWSTPFSDCPLFASLQIETTA